MKSMMLRGLMAMAAVMGTFGQALAAGAREDSSGLVVWMFLGFCALIVLLQLMPALALLFGMVRGLVTRKDEAADTAKS